MSCFFVIDYRSEMLSNKCYSFVIVVVGCQDVWFLFVYG